MKNYDLESYKNEGSDERFYREDAYLRAKQKVKKILGFYWHLASYIIVNLFIIILIVSNGGEFFSFGTFATPLFWGIGLLFHFLSVYGVDFIFGKKWEERKIAEYMEKEKRNINLDNNEQR
ncbi:2TM domain-containing protein [Aestuariibaculum sp. YM273]|uniref:2TM domain-containing protein n=1 Tax=Aestuariibaculum sp. YM273 TaxID=3070659 RepID=UPI0027DBBAEF|nr:2TM domain-containing protein [Aestuariibaculum sp. YM273]WMI64475.1 2TM domain-containing protein [Aestuariibaculum sp. YM273]